MLTTNKKFRKEAIEHFTQAADKVKDQVGDKIEEEVDRRSQPTGGYSGGLIRISIRNDETIKFSNHTDVDLEVYGESVKAHSSYTVSKECYKALNLAWNASRVLKSFQKLDIEIIRPTAETSENQKILDYLLLKEIQPMTSFYRDRKEVCVKWK
jgi:hypothetical protein